MLFVMTVLAQSTLPQALLEQLGGAGVLEPEAMEALALARGMPVAVACSGGPDSVAVALLALALHEGPITLLHFNHNLRGAQSDADEAFVRELAQSMGCDFRSARWQNPSKQNEVAARDARLEFLHRWEHSIILFGQHADDAAETLLMRLARGSSLTGLTAPHPVVGYGAHRHLRPLLKLRKAAIVSALQKLGIAYRLDQSNETADYLRNRIRNELLPLWQSFEPTRDVVEGILASRGQLRSLEDPQSFAAADELGGDARANWKSVSLPVGTTVFLPGGMAVSARRVEAPSIEDLRKASDCTGRVWVSLTDSLELSRWEAGQRYTPLGAPGSRKIKSILNEAAGSSLSPAKRASLPLVCFGDTPIWLPYARITSAAALSNKEKFAVELRFWPDLSMVISDA